MMMRTAVAFVMAVMLLSIATVCPAIACPLGQVSGTQKQVVLPPTATTTHILSTNHDTKLSVSESRKKHCCDYHT